MQAVGRVDQDGSRYLLGDSLGKLHMLVLSHDSQRVVGLKLEALGRISAPSTLSYLDSGVVFVVCCLACVCQSLALHRKLQKTLPARHAEYSVTPVLFSLLFMCPLLSFMPASSGSIDHVSPPHFLFQYSI